MNEQKHIIKKEVLELTVPDRANALPIQNKASEIVKYRLNPALDKLFSKISSADEVVKVDRLVIDLGTIQSNKLDQEVLTRVIQATEKQLTKLIEKNKAKTKEPAGSDSDQKEEEVITIISPQEDFLEQFIYFLKTGNLGWSKTSYTKDPVGEMIRQILVLDKAIFSSRLLPFLKRKPIQTRLVQQLSTSQLYEFLENINISIFQQLSDLDQAFKEIAPMLFKDPLKLSSHFWEVAIEWISSAKDVKTNSQIITFLAATLVNYLQPLSIEKKKEELLKSLKSAVKDSEKSLEEKHRMIIAAILKVVLEEKLSYDPFIGEIKKSNFQSDKFFRSYFQQLEQKLEESEKTESKESKEDEKLKSKNEEEILSESVLKSDMEKRTDVEEEKKKSKIKDEEETDLTVLKAGKSDKKELSASFRTIPPTSDIIIQNAGLVLLHPMLKYFFGGLNLLDQKDQFKNSDDANKAVHLLQYLVTEKQTNPEYDLALNKILCGIDMDEPIPLEVKLSQEEIDECENLLLVVLDRWKALKTSKTEALRQTYLKREGILSFGNQGWNLKIERNTFDVMLDRFPWGFSIIKLPWNPQILYVEW